MDIPAIVAYLRPLPLAAKLRRLEMLDAMVLKPHVVRKGKQWVAIDVGIEGKPQPTWTAAVRYAREWHRNKYGHLTRT